MQTQHSPLASSLAATSDIPISDIPFDSLLLALQTSQESIVQAAQQARNRGLKLLLKSFAQQHADFQAELRSLAGRPASSARAAVPGSAGGSVQQGWTNLSAWFTVRRQSRQRRLLQEAQRAEQSAVTVYEQALQQAAAEHVGTTLRRQLAVLQSTEQRLGALAAPRSDQAMLVRLYESQGTADQVVNRLVAAGVGATNIYTADVDAVTPYEEDLPQRERARWVTMLVASLLGAAVGMLIVLPFAIGQRLYLPQVNGILADTANGVLLEYLIGGAIVGAIFGFYFSIFIGQDLVEDDAYFYAESLENGRVLLAVATDPTSRPLVERLLGLQHQAEVTPQAA